MPKRKHPKFLILPFCLCVSKKSETEWPSYEYCRIYYSWWNHQICVKMVHLNKSGVGVSCESVQWANPIWNSPSLHWRWFQNVLQGCMDINWNSSLCHIITDSEYLCRMNVSFFLQTMVFSLPQVIHRPDCIGNISQCLWSTQNCHWNPTRETIVGNRCPIFLAKTG